ncbi:MAG: NYN domain-containing protein [Candidatus Electryonea clarkiae]|nr:NYN domain-containing protein [Candidatus Electryonea clarkiae]MDP8286978.1 NYN domain-containing protein [Candidatus Electryonea clarkiae]
MFKDSERKIALFIDYDNIAIGLREAGQQRFDARIILERMLEKGRIIYKRAYADWSHFFESKQSMHEAGIELVDIPMRRNIGKNSADIRLVVDALDLCYTKEHIDTFVIGSGDSDFSPLVSKLKENDKKVIGFGLRASTSHLLADNCDEFIFYEELFNAEVARPPVPPGLTKNQNDAFTLILDAVAALMRENKDVLWGSLVKDSVRRKRPSFNESQYGYSSFSLLLEDTARHHLIGLIKDPRSGGTPIITGFGSYSTPDISDKAKGYSASPLTSQNSSLLVNREAKLHTSPVTDKIAGGTKAVKKSVKNTKSSSLVSRTRVSSSKKTDDKLPEEKKTSASKATKASTTKPVKKVVSSKDASVKPEKSKKIEVKKAKKTPAKAAAKTKEAPAPVDKKVASAEKDMKPGAAVTSKTAEPVKDTKELGETAEFVFSGDEAARSVDEPAESKKSTDDKTNALESTAVKISDDVIELEVAGKKEASAEPDSSSEPKDIDTEAAEDSESSAARSVIRTRKRIRKR